MSICAHDVLSEKVLIVDAAAKPADVLDEIRGRRASHVAIIAQGQFLGVASLNDVEISSGHQTFGDLVEGQPCAVVSGITSLEELGRLFVESNVEAQVVHNDLGEFVGVVTRQSLLETLLRERNQTEESPSKSNFNECSQADSLLDRESQFLESILTSTSQDGGLTKLVEVIESLSDGMFCAILLMDKDGLRLRSGAAISLPDEYIRALDGMRIGPDAGCCGTAAFLNQSVIVTDIASDPLWVNFRDLAMKHGLRACWSVPIRSSSRKVLGTFAMYYGRPRSPDAYHESLIDRAAHLAAIAIERKNSEDALARSEQRLRRAQQIAHVGSFELAADGFPTYWSDECFRIVGLDPNSEIPSREKFLEQVIHPDDLEFSQRAVRQSLEGSGSFSYEYRVRRPDGSIRWFHARGIPNRDAAEQIVSVVGTLQDITDSKQTEEALRVSENVF